MTKATLIRTFNWGWLTGSEVQSIFIWGGGHDSMQDVSPEKELRVLDLDLDLDLQAVGRRLSFGWGGA